MGDFVLMRYLKGQAFKIFGGFLHSTAQIYVVKSFGRNAAFFSAGKPVLTNIGEFHSCTIVPIATE